MQIDGRQVRRVLVTWLMQSERPLTVPELAQRLADAGLSVTGRPGKVVSDSLRWELARGRVVRVARGSYRIGLVPRSTAYKIMRQAVEIQRGRIPGGPPPVDEVTAAATTALAEFVARRSA